MLLSWRVCKDRNERGTLYLSLKLLSIRQKRDFMRFVVLPIGFLLLAAPLWAADAAYSVNRGIHFYEQGDYAAALIAFDNAEKIAPNDLRISYNQACALLAEGRTDEAVEKFRKTAFAPNRELVYDSLLNLGGIAADHASEFLDDPPEKTLSENRRKALAELKTAEKEFADAILVLPDRTEAKENLEAIRAWKIALEELWKKQNRQERIETFTSMEMLDYIERRQRAIRDRVAVEQKLVDSPKKFQILYLCAKSQTELVPEINVFWKKIQADYAHGSRLVPPSEDRDGNDKFSLEKTNRLIEEFSQHVAKSTSELKAYNGDSSFRFQAAALEMLDAIHNDFRNYEQLVQVAAEEQGGLFMIATKSDCDTNELLWKQRFVYRWVQLFLKDAKRETAKKKGTPTETPLLAMNVDDMFLELEIAPEELVFLSQQTALASESELERLFKEVFTELEENRSDNFTASMRQIRDILRKILEPLDEKSKMLPDSEIRSSRRTESGSDSFGDFENEDRQDEDETLSTGSGRNSKSGRGAREQADNSSNSSEETKSEKSDGNSEESPENSGEMGKEGRGEGKEGGSKENEKEGGNHRMKQADQANATQKLIDSFAENMTGSQQGKDKQGKEISSNQTSRGGSEPNDGSAKSNKSTSQKSQHPQTANHDSNGWEKLTPEQLELMQRQKQENQEQAKVLIRVVKRRQQEAEKFRNQIRQLFEPAKERERKDW